MDPNPKYLYLATIIFCLTHLVRDHLQIQEVHNFFTDTGHELLKSPEHEKDGMFMLGMLATFALYLFERDEEKEVKERHGFLNRLKVRF